MDNFTWFDETDFVTSGCFETLVHGQKGLLKLTLHTQGQNLDEKKLWPNDMAKIMDDVAGYTSTLVEDLVIPTSAQDPDAA